MRIVIAGASGFLGSHLTTTLLRNGHEVTRLVRREAKSADESSWDPYAGRIDPSVVDAADVVLNLSGSSTIGNPHSGKWARNLHDSRVATTDCLATAIAASTSRPALYAGNAIGWYGDHGADLITDDSASLGDSFMTGVCRDWAEATRPASDAGARVVRLHTAPIIDATSAPMKQMLPAFRLGLGARIGDGRQYFPIVSLRDWTGAVTHLIEREVVTGPYIVAAPQTPTNVEYTDAFAQAVGRKARLSAPASILKRAAGRLSPELLGSQRVEPAAVLASGYTFRDEDVRAVIAAGAAARR